MNQYAETIDIHVKYIFNLLHGKYSTLVHFAKDHKDCVGYVN